MADVHADYAPCGEEGLFAAVHTATGGARMIELLGE